jgi:hypothetical protein
MCVSARLPESNPHSQRHEFHAAGSGFDEISTPGEFFSVHFLPCFRARTRTSVNRDRIDPLTGTLLANWAPALNPEVLP